jgi:ribosome biogenesis GTPase / thiamine phosphate phosphatase
MTIENKSTILDDYGYDSNIEDVWSEINQNSYLLARVVAEYRQIYKVVTTEGEYLARITGKHIFDATNRECFPAVGDWVAIADYNGEKAIIVEILPRMTILKKKNASMRERYGGKQEAQIVATNIDTAFVIESTDRDYSLNRFERHIVQIKDGGIKPAIVLNKTDLISETELEKRVGQIKKRFKDVDVIPTSAVTKTGLSELITYIKKGKTYCFVGSSGVGKSSLINKLLNENRIKTNEVGGTTGRGKHTTTTREMYLLRNGGLIIDNPGSREVGLTDSVDGIEDVFNEITDLSNRCRYGNCTHLHEPGCAVLRAIKEKSLDEEKYDNYLKLKKEVEYYEMSGFEKREKDRKFGKFVKVATDQLKKTK